MARSPRKLDDRDRDILRLLRTDSRRSITELARAIGRSETACSKRVEKLEELGYIEKYTISISEKKAKYLYFKYLFVKTKTHTFSDENLLENFIRTQKDIIFCDSIDGPFDYILKVGCMSDEHQEAIYRALTNVESVSRVRTISRLASIKDFYVDIERII